MSSNQSICFEGLVRTELYDSVSLVLLEFGTKGQ